MERENSWGEAFPRFVDISGSLPFSPGEVVAILPRGFDFIQDMTTICCK
jgi:hypothetical protein